MRKEKGDFSRSSLQKNRREVEALASRVGQGREREKERDLEVEEREISRSSSSDDEDGALETR